MAEPKLKLWGRANSVNVQKALWAILEAGVAHERIDAGGAFGRTDSAEFLAMNPMQQVPVLDDGGFTLCESNVIVRYIADTYARGTLAPQDRTAFAVADQWMEWTSTSLQPDIITSIFWGLIRTPIAQRNVAAIEASVQRAGERLAILDRRLAGRDYIGGMRLTMADIPTGSLMYRYFTLPIARPSLPNVEAWYRRLCERPAYQAAVMVDYSSLKVEGA